jgi:CRISPR-associated protein Cas2
MRILVCYDVVKDNQRRRLADRLERLLQRVQKSVFEGRSKEKALEQIRDLARSEIDLKTDSVRIYFLCARCREATEVIGAGPVIAPGPEDIVL